MAKIVFDFHSCYDIRNSQRPQIQHFSGMRPYTMTFSVSTLVVWLFLFSLAAHSEVVTDFHADPALTREGFITLSWNSAVHSEERPTVLQISSDHTFSSILYSLALAEQQKVHLTGFSDGQYYTRLLDPQMRPITSPVTFEVKHRDLDTAIRLFIAGLILFLILVSIMFRFTRRA